MILFQNWNIEYIGGLFARQYDNLSRKLEVTGVPDGYDWAVMAQVGENFDILSLSPMEGGVGVVLTANQLSIAGYYKLQLVGTLRSDGVTKRHTNVLQVYVPGSLSGDVNWPTVPSEFSQVEANIRELNSHPPIPGDNGYWMIWDLESHGYTESEFPLPEVATGTGGTNDHSKLTNRNAADQHPMSAITGLEAALDGKQPVGSYITEESDPTVPEWAKQPQKPAYTAQEVGALPNTTAIPSTAADVNAEPSGAVSQHNVSDAAHSDIRLLIQGLTDRLNALADSDDTTLDQLSEIVAYIKSNRDLISSITTSKVSVTDIVDDLVTSVADKPLSAAQGVALKALIDAISLPAATAEDAGKVPVVQADGSYGLGSMIPAPETAEVGQTIVVKAVDENGKPTEWEASDMAGGGWELITDVTIDEDGGGGSLIVTKNDKGEDFEYRQCMICLSGTVIDGWPGGASQYFYLYANNTGAGPSASQALSRLAAGGGGTTYKSTIELSIFGGLLRTIACGGQYDNSSLIIRNESPIDTFRSIRLKCFGNSQWVTVPFAAGGRIVIYGRK